MSKYLSNKIYFLSLLSMAAVVFCTHITTQTYFCSYIQSLQKVYIPLLKPLTENSFIVYLFHEPLMHIIFMSTTTYFNMLAFQRTCGNVIMLEIQSVLLLPMNRLANFTLHLFFINVHSMWSMNKSINLGGAK